MRKRGAIKTVHIYPPIPDRRFDWCAYRDGEEETGRAGYGATEQEALADLAREEQEQSEWLDWPETP